MPSDQVFRNLKKGGRRQITKDAILQAILCSVILFSVSVNVSYAFNTPTHHQILKSALHYLKAHGKNPQTQEWLKIAEKIENEKNHDPLERLFVRSIIDTDYQDDLWLDAWYLKPISAGKINVLGMLTSLYHFTNVTKPGEYWQYDGYAYKNTDGLGNDYYLGGMGLRVRVDLSSPMQKYATSQKTVSMAEISIPPSYLIAHDAFDEVIASSPSTKSVRTTWEKQITYADSYVLNSWINRRYAEEEIEGLPVNLQKLGVTMHMAQDLAMPHHAQGVAGLCHSEFESYIDDLMCDNETISTHLYDSGVFDEARIPNCQNLYSSENVGKLIAHNPIFDFRSDLSIEERLIGIAKMTAQYRINRSTISNDAIHISFEGKNLFADRCENIKNSYVIKMIGKRQYEIATAATVMLIELAAQQYEKKWNVFAQNTIEQCQEQDTSPAGREILALKDSPTQEWVLSLQHKYFLTD